jgi:hypothetical protein
MTRWLRWALWRLRFAWANRCVLCLVHPFHGEKRS